MGPVQRAVNIPAGSVQLDADLVPARPGRGTVVFAHGSGSGRRSSWNRQVATHISRRGLASGDGKG